MVLLEMHLLTVVDPLEQVVCEHLVTFYRILRSSPTTKEEVAKAWPLVKSRLQASPHPWKVVSGPVSASWLECALLQPVDGRRQ